MNPPLVKYSPDTYAFRWLEEKVDITLDRIHEARSGILTAEIEVRCSRDIDNALVHHAQMNLVSTQTRTSVVRALDARTPDIDWGAALEMVCHLALRQWREGEPVLDLRCVSPREGSRFLLPPFVEYGGPTILFAEGGTGKSLFGLAIAASIASGEQLLGIAPTRREAALYLDWESDAETHADRLRALCMGQGIAPSLPAVHYRRQAASLAESAPHIRKVIAEKQIGFVIIDSMGAARGGEPESADSTIRLFNAARSLGVPWMGIDHVTKNGGDVQTKPFGSIYTVNLARLTWRLEQVEEAGNGRVLIAASNHKANNGRLEKRRGYEVEFRSDDDGRPIYVAYQDRDTRDMPGMLPKLPQPLQVTEILRANNGAMPIEDIQRCLEAEGITTQRDTLRMTLNRHKDRFVPTGEGKAIRWGLRLNG